MERLFQIVLLVRTFLKGKENINHLLGTELKPGNLKFDAWDEDFMIMAWLWNLILPEISDTYMFLAISIDIRDVVRQTYSKIWDTTQIYELKVNTAYRKQKS